MHLIVQIPAYNEEKTIAEVIKSIPRKIKGIGKIEILVIDDGSRDNTFKLAKDAGADYIIRNNRNLGLAHTFQKGINKALELGADIIVNTDADNQYNQKEIPLLIKPILEGRADMVSGNRQIEKLTHMSGIKKYGNIIGSNLLRIAMGKNVIDASSGFRAYSRESAMKLFVRSNHTYTHETLIQAVHKKLKVMEVPIEFRKRNGESKLIGSVSGHINKSMASIARSILMYNSLRFFSYIGFFLILIGIIPIIRWLILSYVFFDGGQHIQSLIIGTLLIIFGGFSILLGFIADLLAVNRKYLEEILYLTRKNVFD
ncbi:MAG: glycosyltransferase family 2 protein [archaeon]